MISPPRCVYNDDTQSMGDLQAVPNAPVKLRAERARFFPVSHRKSVNAKEPSASSACYVAQSNSFNSSTVNLACLSICERVERLMSNNRMLCMAGGKKAGKTPLQA